MKKTTLCWGTALPVAAVVSAVTAQAQFNPLPITPESFGYDIVVEKEAMHPFLQASTASLDGGTANSGFTFYEAGYNPDAFETGIPNAGTTATSVDLPDHSFVFATDYTANNALLIDTNITTGRLTLAAPAAYSSLSFLGASGNGNAPLNYTIHFADGSNETGSFTVLDWFNGGTAAFVLNGRAGAQSGAYGNVNSGFPKLFAFDVPVTSASKPIQSVELSYGPTGPANAHAAIFAVSGSTGAEFAPIPVTGFNQDMIVEATATHPGRVLTAEGLDATTASMDAAAGNTGFTWYEQGYATNNPATGLPVAGTTLTNQAASDHVYRMAASYAANNAVIIDSANVSANLSLASPATASALSFLASSGNGSVTVDYTAYHEDGSTSTGSFVVPDWFGGNPYAFTTRGRVSVDSGGLDNVNAENPRLYGIDVTLQNSSSPVTSIDLSYQTGAGHAAILAVSGTAGAVRPIFEAQPASIVAFAGSPVELTATVTGDAPITFQYQKNVNGTYVNVANGNGISGANTATLNFSNPTLADLGGYILIAANSAGRSTSLVANVTILSSLADITSPEDTIEGFGGTWPDGEAPANAFNNNTTKYLNFGPEGDPFAGPVGVTVTPAIGSTVVSGIRFYTANDANERDPMDFLLEGSTDGETYTRIAGGALNLPTARNNAGLELNALGQAIQEVNFANTAGYTSYRITFNTVRGATANSMQIGEVELLGVEGAGTVQTRLTITKTGASEVTISWNGGGTLEAAPTVLGSWSEVGAANPVTLPITGAARFFRVRQ